MVRPLCHKNSSSSALGTGFANSSTAVFDLETNSTYLAQYQNCGTNTVTITSPATIGTLSGTCGFTQSSVAGQPGAGIGSNSGNAGDPSNGATQLLARAAQGWALLGTCVALMAAALL